MDHFYAMRVFCQIIDAGGMAGAARALGVGPAAVTQVLARLEQHLGVRLLNRTTRRIAITEAGQMFYDHARRMIEQLAEAEDAVRSQAAAPAGWLRVTLPLGLAHRYIYPHLAEFSACHPQIRLDLQVNDERIDLVRDNIDVGLRVGYLEHAEWIAKPLLRYQRVTCVSPAYRERHGVPLHPRELIQHNCLLYRHQIGAVHWDYLIDDRIERIAVEGSLVSNESNALLTWARNGQGITRQPDWLVAGDIRQGYLITVLDAFSIGREVDLPGIYALLPRRQYQPAKVTAFITFFAQKIGQSETAR